MSGPSRPTSPSGPSGPTRDRTADVAATARAMWSTRPERRTDDRMIAGVGAAIARRYALDPTVVRVVLGVSAFWGLGLLLYLTCWLVLPHAAWPGRTTVPAAVAGTVSAVAGLTIVAVGPVGAIVALLVVAALLLALHAGRADRGVPGPGAGEPADGDAGERDPAAVSATVPVDEPAACVQQDQEDQEDRR